MGLTTFSRRSGEPLILGESGPEIKSYAAAGQAMLFLVLIPAYGSLAAKVNRIRLITWVTLFFISHLGIAGPG